MEHTPTPLHVRSINAQGNYMCHSYIYSGEELVATVTKPGCAHEIVEACNAHERLKRERDALRDAAKEEIAKPTMHNKNLHGRPCSMQRSEGGLCECGVLPDLQITLALCERKEA